MTLRLRRLHFSYPGLLGAARLAFCVWLLPISAHGQSVSDRGLAIGLAEEGRCETALPVLDRVQTDPASDAEVARLQGQCAIRLQNFRFAIDSLESARALDPMNTEVDLYLGMAYYHSGRIDEAEDALARLGAVSGDRAEFLLYSGLVAFAQSDYSAAITRLDAASRRSEAPVEPMASFFLGRAAIGANRLEQARTSFERVVSEHGGTPWADEAERAIAEIDGAGDVEWWSSLEVGFEHDDNVLLRGLGVGLPADISGQSDQRFFWFVDVGAEVFEVGGFRGGAALRYAGSEHLELERFDTHSPGVTLWIDRELGLYDSSLRIQYDFDSTWIDAKEISDEPFALSHLLGASLYKPWEDGDYTILSSSVGYDDYGFERFDLPGSARNERDATNRDGWGVSASLLHHVAIAFENEWLVSPWVEGEYRYQQNWSDGSEYDQERHQIELALGVLLPFEIGFRVSGRYAYAPFGNPSVFPDRVGDPASLDTRNRREHQAGFRVAFERAIGEQLVVTARYSRTQNFSTADVFSYSRDLVGLSVRIGFGS